MATIKRQSPVSFHARPGQTVIRDYWEVTLAFDGEGPGPWLVDLCHKPRWDIQDSRLDDLTPAGLAIPQMAGTCRLEKQILINRMNQTQAAVWHLGNEEAPPLPTNTGYTNVSEATVFLALFGPGIFAIAEKLTALDITAPKRKAPFLLQGPFAHVPCQIVALAREDGETGGLLLTCSRGYAQDMVHAIESAGKAYGLGPAGEDRFTAWLAALKP